MSDPLFAVARKEVDDGDFYHGVAPRLLLHGSACHAHKYLCSQCRIVDAHIELEQLILRFTGKLPCESDLHRVPYRAVRLRWAQVLHVSRRSRSKGLP